MRSDLARHAALTLALAGCGGGPVVTGNEPPVYFRVAGGVEADVPDHGELAGAIAWIWEAAGTSYAWVQTTPLEPRVLSYVLDVPPPPSAAEATVVGGAARVTPPGVALIIGIPLLYETTGEDGPPSLVASPDAMGEWIDGTVRDVREVVTPREQSGERVVAVARDHLLIGAWCEPEVNLLAEHPRFRELQPWAALEDVWAGLTLYRRAELGTEAWRPLAAPGQRTEFQGVSMKAPAP